MEDRVGAGAFGIARGGGCDPIPESFSHAGQGLLLVSNFDSEESLDRDLPVFALSDFEGLGLSAQKVEDLLVVDFEKGDGDAAVVALPALP